MLAFSLVRDTTPEIMLFTRLELEAEEWSLWEEISSSSLVMVWRSGATAAVAPRIEDICMSTLSGVDVNSGEDISVDSLERRMGFIDVLVSRLPSPGGR
jgi:hypothetical protein